MSILSQKNWRVGLVIFLALANALAWYVFFSNWRGEILTVAFLDVGQGDAIFIEAPNGNQIIFDGGPNGKILSELGKLMPFFDRAIDMIVITNPDRDHLAGFLDILERYEVGKFMEPGTKSDTAVYKELKKAIAAEAAEKILARRGMRIELDRARDIFIEILFPDRDVSGISLNDGSIVARLVYGHSSVMLTGDTTKKIEDYLVELDLSGQGNEPNQAGQTSQSLRLKSDVLKVAHHGSKTSSAENFVKSVTPKYAVISSGKGNRYGHPSEETLATLQKFGVEILRTDSRGTIVMKSDGRSIWPLD